MKSKHLIHTLAKKYTAVLVTLCMVASLVPSAAIACQDEAQDQPTCVTTTPTCTPFTPSKPTCTPTTPAQQPTPSCTPTDPTTPKPSDCTPTQPSTPCNPAPAQPTTPDKPSCTPTTPTMPSCPQTVTYTITFKNADGTVLQSGKVKKGELPVYNGKTPTKPADDKYTYEFTGWTPQIVNAYGDAVYTATFKKTPKCTPTPTPCEKKYTVKWVNYDGKTLEVDKNVPKGTDPEYNGATPTRPDDFLFTYEFEGWTPELSPVTGDITYTATFKKTLKCKKYTVTWVDEDGTQLELDENVPYGTDPKFDGETPTKPADEQYTYEFDGWTPEVSPVTGDVTYTATYKETLREYTVTWVDEDGTQLELDENVPYGTDPKFDGETPTKPATDQYTYEFDGWTPEVSPVTGDVTYTATYKETVRLYTITYDLNGGTLDGKTGTFNETYGYGEVITIAAKPSREGYTFLYWKGSSYQPGDKYTVKGDHTFVAQWKKNGSNTTPKKASAKVASTKLPKTGDSSFAPVIIAIALAGVALVIASIYKRRRSTSEK